MPLGGRCAVQETATSGVAFVATLMTFMPTYMPVERCAPESILAMYSALWLSRGASVTRALYASPPEKTGQERYVAAPLDEIALDPGLVPAPPPHPVKIAAKLPRSKPQIGR